jgi:hypothetical protein
MEEWADMAVDAWVVVAELYLSVLEIGSVDLKVVVTTTLPRTSAVFVVVQAVLVLLSSPIQAILRQWKLPLATEWVLDQWLALPALVHLLPQQVGSAPVADMDNTLAVRQAPMLCPQVLVLPLVLTHP